jgi:polo-like kinase 4
MSNIPKPDIELLFPASPSTNAGIQSKPISQPAMRIRLSPKDKTIEISRFAPSSFGASGNGEWTKKIISYAENDDGTLRLNRSQLSTEEKEGLKHLRECRMASEGMQRRLTSQGKQKESPDSTSTVTLSASTKPLNRRTTSSTAQYLSGLKISPRPEKLSPSLKQPPHSATKPTTGDPDLLRAIRSVGIQINNGSSNAPATPSLSSETQYHPPPDTFESEIETRFMPSVGWCMRYQSTARRSGHMYRVMFLDGACLEVDVQRSEATLTLQDGTNRSAHCPIQ